MTTTLEAVTLLERARLDQTVEPQRQACALCHERAPVLYSDQRKSASGVVSPLGLWICKACYSVVDKPPKAAAPEPERKQPMGAMDIIRILGAIGGWLFILERLFGKGH